METTTQNRATGVFAERLKRAVDYFRKTGKDRCTMVRGKIVEDAPRRSLWAAKLGANKTPKRNLWAAKLGSKDR